MSFPQFGEIINEDTPEFEQYGEIIEEPISARKGKKSKLEKSARLGAQYGLGATDLAMFPLTLQSQVLESPEAQHAEFRKGIFEDIERLAEQKSTGVWDEQDENLFQELQEQIRNPEKAEGFVKTANISPSGLIRKGIKESTGYDLEPEGTSEKLTEIAGNLRLDKLLRKAPQAVKSFFNKEARTALKAEKQWKNLERAAAGNPERETLLNFSRSLNLTPEAANLLFHSRGNAKFLEATAKKSKRFKNAIKELRDKLGSNYQELKRLGKEGGDLNLKESEALTSDLGKILSEIGETFVEGPDTKSARLAIEGAIDNIMNKGGTVKELINSRQGLKEGINWNKIDRGDAILSQADKAFMDAIKNKNPDVYERLLDTDKSWAKYKQFSKAISEKTPAFKYKGVSLPPIAGPAIAYGLTYAFGGFKGLIAKEVLQRLSTKIAINPAFRQPLKRFQNSLLSGSKKNQKQSFLTIKNLMKDQDPELYEEIKDLEID